MFMHKMELSRFMKDQQITNRLRINSIYSSGVLKRGRSGEANYYKNLIETYK